MVDLHTHTTASDGTLAPAELVELAARRGVTALALTDHDTVAGLPEALARGRERGVEVVPGVEVGVQWDEDGAMHLLGYFVRHEDQALLRRLGELCGWRRDRAQEIVQRLNEAGVQVSFEQVEAVGPGCALGRPHVAQALLKAGAVRSVGEAFQRYLRRGRPGYVARAMPSPDDGIALLHAAGGVAVLAHPSTLRLGRQGLKSCLEQLQGWGLDGIEVYSSGHGAAQRETYLVLAGERGLLVTGGSDFHGATKPDIQLGSGLGGNAQVPDAVLEELRRAAAARAQS